MRTLIAFLLLLTVCFTGICFAQIKFARSVRDTTGFWNQGYSVVQTSDNGFVVVGVDHYGFLVKFNSLGSYEWSLTERDTLYAPYSAWYNSAFPTTDGGLVAAGSWISKFSSSGDIEWSRALGEDIRSVVQTSDGGYAVAGAMWDFGAGSTDLFLVKLNSTGIIQWSRAVGGASDDYGRSVVQTSDGGYVVAGTTNSFGAGHSDLFLVKFSSTGNVEWSRAVGGASYDGGYSVVQTADGGYAMAGTAEASALLVKFNSSGMLEWSRTIDQPETFFRGMSMVKTYDGGYSIAACVDDTSYERYLCLLEFDSLGELERCHGFRGVCDSIVSLIQTSDSGYALVGTFFEPGGDSPFLIKFSSDGNSCIAETGTLPVTTASPTITITTPSVAIISPIVTILSPTITDITLIVTEICTETYMEIYRGWNLVSVPSTEPQPWTFLGGIPNGYDPITGSYFTSDSLKPKKGYFVLRTTSDIITLPNGLFSYTDSIFRGWNLIGTVDHPIFAGSFLTIPDGLQIAPFFGWDNPSASYFEADSLFPGRGYWFLSNGNGIITVGP